jgi:molecular chaperone GrpE
LSYEAEEERAVSEQQTTPQQTVTAENHALPEQPPSLTPEETAALQTKAAERDKFLDLLQRTRADFENYQKRNQRDREQERKYMYGPFVRDLLPVFDNLQRATAAAKQAGETGPLVKGVDMVQTQFLELLKRYGVIPIEALGKPFDPNLHEAVVHQPAPHQPPDTVIQVLEQGFMNQDRVLRPAKVIVSKAE